MIVTSEMKFKGGEGTIEEIVVELLKPNKWYWSEYSGFPILYDSDGGTPIGDNQEIIFGVVNDYIVFTILRPKAEGEDTWGGQYNHWYDFGGVYKDGEIRLYECDGNWVDVDDENYDDLIEMGGRDKKYLDDLKNRITNYLNDFEWN